MDRRNFLGGLLALLASPFIGKAKEPEPSYLFDWTCPPPFTDDPEHAGSLSYGIHNRVSLDGADTCRSCFRFQTGPDGWIEEPVRDAEGNMVFEIWNNWDGKWWDVKNIPEKKWNIARVEPDGSVLPKYGDERTKSVTLRGHVRYWNTIT